VCKLKNTKKNLLVIQPRHPARNKKIIKLIKKYNLTYKQRSKGELPNNNTNIYLFDTFGESGLLISISDLIIIGGTLVSVGGHNLLESAQFGKNIIVGPYTQKIKEVVGYFKKNNAIETSHKEGKDDDMNNVDTRGWDDSKKGLGGTERDRSEASTTGGDTGEGKDALETGAETKGEDSTQDAGKKVQGRKHRKEHIETNPEEKPDTHGHGKRSETKEESEGHTRASSTVENASAKFTTSGGAAQAELDSQTEASLGGNAEVQAARYSKQQMDKKREVRAGRKQQSGEIPKKVTTGVSALKAWQLWLAKREQQVLKDAPKDTTPKEDKQQSNLPKKEKPDSGYKRTSEISRDSQNSAHQGLYTRLSTAVDEMDKKVPRGGKAPTTKAWEEWLEYQKSNTERSIHGNAGREPNSGVNTNTGFDASEDYEGFSHSGLRPEQFKHEKVKPKVTTKERINIGTTNPSKPSAGTGDGGNPYDTKTQNKDKKGRAVAGKDKK
jgi:hypothetical protein